MVAAPTFPRSSGPGAGDSDLPQQPKDVRFLISSLSGYFSRRSNPLLGHVLIGCVAVAGHSGGAATALSVGYESGVADRRIRAVVSMSGIVVPLTGGSFAIFRRPRCCLFTATRTRRSPSPQANVHFRN